MDAELLRGRRLLGAEKSAEEAGLLTLDAGVGIYVTHVVVACGPISVVHAKPTRIQCDADSTPRAFERLRNHKRSLVASNRGRNLGLLRRTLGLGQLATRSVDVVAQEHHQASEHGGVQTGILAAIDPAYVGFGTRQRAFFFHVLVRDIDLGTTRRRRAFDARAEFVARTAIPQTLEHRPQRLANPAFGDLGTVFGPVGDEQTSLGIHDVKHEPVFSPEIADLGEHLIRRHVDHQPAQIAIAFDAHVVALWQHAGCARDLLRVLGRDLALLVLRIGRGARRACRCLVTGISASLREIGRDAQRIGSNHAPIVD